MKESTYFVSWICANENRIGNAVVVSDKSGVNLVRHIINQINSEVPSATIIGISKV